MNGYERIKAALEGHQPDRTPVMLHNFMMAAKEAGFSMEEYRNDPEKIAKTFIQAVETYGYDGVLVDLDTATLAGAVGVPVDFPLNEPARIHEGNLSSLDNIEDLKPVDISKYKYVQIWAEAVRLLKDHFKNEIYIRGNCDQAPFSLASMMRSPQEWLMDLMMNEEKAIQLIEYCTGITCQFIEIMAASGCDMVSNGDSTAGPEMISPDMYRTFALPYEKRVVETAHNAGVAYTLHICGNTDVILSDMLTSGADAIEVDYKTDIEKACELCIRESKVFIGNIDPSGVIALGSVNDVKNETEKLLNIFAGNPRFILNAGCAIPSIAPSENIHAMMEAVKKEI